VNAVISPQFPQNAGKFYLAGNRLSSEEGLCCMRLVMCSAVALCAGSS